MQELRSKKENIQVHYMSRNVTRSKPCLPEPTRWPSVFRLVSVSYCRWNEHEECCRDDHAGHLGAYYLYTDSPPGRKSQRTYDCLSAQVTACRWRIEPRLWEIAEVLSRLWTYECTWTKDCRHARLRSLERPHRFIGEHGWAQWTRPPTRSLWEVG